MIRPQAQLDEGAGIGCDFRLPAIVSLIPRHGGLCARVPVSGGLAIQIFLPDQSLLYLGCAGGINLLLSVVFPRALPGAAMFGAFMVD